LLIDGNAYLQNFAIHSILPTPGESHERRAPKPGALYQGEE